MGKTAFRTIGRALALKFGYILFPELLSPLPLKAPGGDLRHARGLQAGSGEGWLWKESNDLTVTVPIIPGRTLVDAAPLPPGIVGPTSWASLESVKAWDLLEAANDAYQHMMTDVQAYLSNTFPTWLSMYESGTIPFNSTPPAPPPKYQAMIDPSGLNSWDLVAVPGSAACAIPPYTQAQAPRPIPTLSGNMLQDLKNEMATSGAAPSQFTNATPILGKQTAPDGSVWVRMQ